MKQYNNSKGYNDNGNPVHGYNIIFDENIQYPSDEAVKKGVIICDAFQAILSIEDTVKNGGNIGFIDNKLKIMDFQIVKRDSELKFDFLDNSKYRHYPLLKEFVKKNKEYYQCLCNLLGPYLDNKFFKEKLAKAYYDIKVLIDSKFYLNEEDKEKNFHKLKVGANHAYIYFRSFYYLIMDLAAELEKAQSQN